MRYEMRSITEASSFSPDGNAASDINLLGRAGLFRLDRIMLTASITA
jgi:hypothetical protein